MMLGLILGVHTDDAGQFDVFHHSLCWIHEERLYRKLILTSDDARADLERVRNQTQKILILIGLTNGFEGNWVASWF